MCIRDRVWPGHVAQTVYSGFLKNSLTLLQDACSLNVFNFKVSATVQMESIVEGTYVLKLV